MMSNIMEIHDVRKAEKKAPCGYQKPDRKGQMQTHYPAVDCTCDCDGCGWNPAEKERRFATGEMLPAEKRIGYDVDKGCLVEVKLPEGTKQLVFKRREAVV